MRSSFLYAGKKPQAKNDEQDKSRKPIIVITLDEEDTSPSKRLIDGQETKKFKTHSKKPVIISLDEKVECEADHAKKKKFRVLSENVNHAKKEKLQEVDLTDVFKKKPFICAEAPKVGKKTSKESKPKTITFIDLEEDDDFKEAPKFSKKASKELKPKTLTDIDLEDDDDFEKALNQLDISKIEDEYLFKNSLDSKQNGKASNQGSHNKVHFSKFSPEKNKTPQKNHGEKKHESKDKKNTFEKEKKKKDQHHPQIEIEVNLKPPKNKANKSNYDNVNYNNIIEERVDRKQQRVIQYHNYLNRGGARNPGSKQVPPGAENCFAKLTFLITGVLESLEREEVKEIIMKYGGTIISNVTTKLDYMIVGDQPGPLKMTKAKNYGIKIISEDDFLNLLRTSSGVQKEFVESSHNKRKRESLISPDEKSPAKKKYKQESSEQDEHRSLEKTNKEPIIIKTNAPMSDVTNERKDGPDHITALTEKYRPTKMKQIIRQVDDKIISKRLYFWLKNWQKNHNKSPNAPKPKSNPYLRDDTGQMFKAALLSGPPGIGKTTMVHVVCNDLGFEVIEFNASDKRSKRLLQEEISVILKNHTIKSFLNAPDASKTPPKHVLLMDEVDGIDGKEDMGGLQELLSFIKTTKIPIICICNNRWNQKIKSLDRYTFDLRFSKPKVKLILAALMSICFEEGIKTTPNEIARIIQSTDQDIRQVINHLALLSAKSSTTSKSDTHNKYKNLQLDPWKVIRKVFLVDEHENMSIHDKSNLFFHDYNISPLFVEENYLFVTPTGSTKDHLEKIARCSESIAIGDMIERTIRNGQNWDLLPVQAIFSSVIPGTEMSGSINSQINFPSWLKHNSAARKYDRMLQEVTDHARMVTGASKEAINLDYLKMITHSMVRPLMVDGTAEVERVIEVMSSYHLAWKDLDSLLKLTKWPHSYDLKQFKKTKKAFTKVMNKTVIYEAAAGATKKKADRGGGDDDGYDDFKREADDEEMASDVEDGKLENDKLIKFKTFQDDGHSYWFNI